MGPHDPRAIANRILLIAQEQGIRLTLMQLIKLVYLANGWWMVFSGGAPLTRTNPQAWQYGPVYPEVYSAFKKHGSSPIGDRAVDPSSGLYFDAPLRDAEESVLKSVVDGYGKHHAFTLSNIMHEPGTPWSITKDSKGLYSEIDPSLIRDHFNELREKRS